MQASLDIMVFLSLIITWPKVIKMVKLIEGPGNDNIHPQETYMSSGHISQACKRLPEKGLGYNATFGLQAEDKGKA